MGHRARIAAVAAGTLACSGLTTSCLSAAFEKALGELFSALSSWQLAEATMGVEPWAPDGESVVVTLWNGLQPVLVQVPLNEEPARKLATGGGPVWSPDGARLAFVLFDPPLTGLCLLDPRAVALPPLAIGPFAPGAWSPAGDWLAASGHDRVVLVRGDGSMWKDVGPGERPVWSNDGAWLACSILVDEQPWIELIEPSAGSRRRLVAGALPSFAPDGARLAYMDFRSIEGGDMFVAVVGIDGSDPRQLCAGVFPRWSPRGDRILFTGGGVDDGHPRDRFGQLSIIRPDGSDARVLAEGAFAPRWSPDATRIAFVRGPLFAQELVVIDAEDGAELLVHTLDLTALDATSPGAP
jgi:Tol biopolymer transport system component